jgi:integrase
MAVRFRKYFKQCRGKRVEGDKHGRVIVRGVECEGKRSRLCPEGVPSPCGAWAIDYRHPDGRWVSKIYPEINTKTEAEHFLSIIKTDILRGKFNLPCKKAIPTLKEYSKTYMEPQRGAKENTLAMKQRGINALIAVLGDYPLNKITPFIIEKYRLSRKGKGIKDSSINLDVSILSNVFATAIKAGIVDKNPCKEVRRLKAIQTRDRVLSQPEIALMLDKLRGKDRLMVLVGLFTGLRLGGVLGLSWHDIDFTKKIVSSSHKTGKLVSIPLSDYLEGELLRYKGNNSGDRVFEGREITNAVVAEYSNHFSKLFKGLGIHNFTFHNLRHSFASILQGELGVGAIVVQGMTGHSSLGMLQKYSHTGLDNKRTAIQALTDHILSKRPETSFAIAQ